MVYMKGALLLLGKCRKMLTGFMGLLNDTFMLMARDESFTFMENAYFSRKRKIREVALMDFITLVESKYRTIYRNRKSDNLKDNPGSGFVIIYVI